LPRSDPAAGVQRTARGRGETGARSDSARAGAGVRRRSRQFRGAGQSVPRRVRM